MSPRKGTPFVTEKSAESKCQRFQARLLDLQYRAVCILSLRFWRAITSCAEGPDQQTIRSVGQVGITDHMHVACLTLHNLMLNFCNKWRACMMSCVPYLYTGCLSDYTTPRTLVVWLSFLTFDRNHKLPQRNTC